MLDQVEELFKIVLSNIEHGVIMCGEDNAVIQANPAFEKITGYANDELIGKDISILTPDNAKASIALSLRESLNSGKPWQGKVMILGRDRAERELHLSIFAPPEQAGAQRSYAMILRPPIVDMPEDAGECLPSDQHDTLTKLPNRFLFKDRAEQSILSAARADKSVAVLIFGLDRFSIINDGLGHSFGNELLKDVAGRLQDCIRHVDTVARIDGDRFAMALQIAEVDDGVIVSEKVLKSINLPFIINNQEVSATASIGISLYPTDGENMDELSAYAESAMHHAKKSGGNQYMFFANQMNIRAKERIEIENNLRRAIQNEEFLLYYQPKVNAETQKIVGMEALIRWQDPEKGIISPGIFIPVAEESGLIGPIGLWCLKEACRQNKYWQDMGLQPVRVSVNVSAHQFKDANFLDNLKIAINESGLTTEYLELELTESLLVDNVEDTIVKLQQIRDLGCELSIDDFGTGYSSLSYLTRFPITVLKIDRAFVHDIEDNESTAEIARAIIGLSQGLKLKVIAEGAETKEHVDFLREHGCSTIQGYYYSKPLPAKVFEDLLKIGSINP